MAVKMEHRKAAPPAPPDYDVGRIRDDFPILRRKVRGKPLAYLDNAATTQKPKAVIDAVCRYYSEDNANVHRGVHFLSQHATELYDRAREKVMKLIGTTSACELVFTRGTTEAINLVAQCYGRRHIGPGDEVLITHMEHHSNIVPWQIICAELGATLRVVPINDAGEMEMESFDRLLNERTKLVSVV
jgi:cysteine desulfurase / selenocysteine lyase